MDTVSVSFRSFGGGYGTSGYTYLIPDSSIVDIGDLIVVPVKQDDAFAVVKVLAKNVALDPNATFEYKPAYGIVNKF